MPRAADPAVTDAARQEGALSVADAAPGENFQKFFALTAMPTQRLFELAKTIRSKDAGVDRITFDVIFTDRASYERVQRTGVLSRDAIARIFALPPAEIVEHVAFDPALAIKFTIRRPVTSGSPGDGDIFGSQQYGPLPDIEVPL
jgi:hypothetical protein